LTSCCLEFCSYASRLMHGDLACNICELHL
jgi:hypothetical protein